MSPATTSPLSSTRSRTSTSPVERPCLSANGIGIVSVFYGYHPAAHASRRLADANREPDYLSNANATASLLAFFGRRLIRLQQTLTVPRAHPYCFITGIHTAPAGDR